MGTKRKSAMVSVAKGASIRNIVSTSGEDASAMLLKQQLTTQQSIDARLGRKESPKSVGYRVALVVSATLVAMISGLVTAHVRYNFHIVRPGQLYRCGQLPDDIWETVIRQYGIRTVINLRGRHPERTWYLAETEAAKRHSVQHFDLPIVRHNLPERSAVEQLFHWHKTVPRPVLVHCQSGTDRTSMIVVFWLLLEDDATVEEARGQMGWLFGQVPWRKGTRQLCGLLDRYQAWLEQHRYRHSAASFRSWFDEEYKTLLEQGMLESHPTTTFTAVKNHQRLALFRSLTRSIAVVLRKVWARNPYHRSINIPVIRLLY